MGSENAHTLNGCQKYELQKYWNCIEMGYFLPTASFCDPIPRTPPQTRVGCRLPDPLHRPPTIVALPSSNASKNHLCTVSAWNMMSLHGDWKTCEMIIGEKPATRGPRATPWKSILKPCRAPFIDFIYIYICVCVCYFIFISTLVCKLSWVEFLQRLL